ncbi:MAG: HK97 family phage prohead protease [Elusimicrobiaceae bacterium]|nr:HK97 family phage prohead protease [Elusimicrobiaceae bacterium]
MEKTFNFDMTVKQVTDNEQEKSIVAVFSCSKKDRAGDVLPPEVLLEGAENFKKNPVLLDSHNHFGVENILGKISDLKAQNGEFFGKVTYFAGKGNQAADWAFKLAKEGIAAFSVGFRALEYEYIKEEGAKGEIFITGLKFKKVELLEISQVSVPCNPAALKKIFCSESTAVPAAPVPNAENTVKKDEQEKETIAKAFTDALAEIK